jgi:hypothetical protein
MSLTSASRELPGRAHLLDQVALLRGQRLAFQQLRQAQHGIQRGADLMAHVGQELGFDPRRLLGRSGPV